MARLTDDDVNEALRAHVHEMDECRDDYRRHRAAYSTRFWRDGIGAKYFAGVLPTEIDRQLPVKVEVNQVYSFVQSHVSNLEYRDPAVVAKLPAAMGMAPGRRRNLEGLPDTMAALVNDWLRAGRIRAATSQAYLLALMYDSSALKLRMCDADDPVQRFAVQAIPRWEAVWDPLAVDETPAYLGHLRHEHIEEARRIVGDGIDDKYPEALQDYLLYDGGRRRGYRGYVRLLEFYDLIEGKQRFYVVTGEGVGAVAKPVGKTEELPFEPRGRMLGCPIVPVVLAPTPEYPLMGIGAVRRVYQLNAEMNLILTVLANAMRSDAKRVWLYAGNAGISDEVLKQIQVAPDNGFVKVDADQLPGDLSRLFVPLPTNPMPQSMRDLVSLITESRRDVQASSDMQQGRQASYISATEANYLAAYGEMTNNGLQARMADATSRLLELLTSGLAEEGEKLSVRVGLDWHELTPDDLRMPWDLRLSDAASTPVREAQRKRELVEIRPALIETVTLASGKLPDGTDVAPQVALLNQRILDKLVKLFDLPESFSWDALLTASAKAPGPEAERARQLLGQMMDQQLADTGTIPDLPPNPLVAMPELPEVP